MEGSALEQELRERLLIQGETFSVNRDRKLTAELNGQIAEELLEAAQAGGRAGREHRKAERPGRVKRMKLSEYAYYLRLLDENKAPLEMLPENTRFKKVKQLLIRANRLVFQWQQIFNNAAKDVMILLSKDMKAMAMRLQSTEERINERIDDRAAEQDEAIAGWEQILKEQAEQIAALEKRAAEQEERIAGLLAQISGTEKARERGEEK